MTKLLAVDDSRTMRKVIEIAFAGEDFETVLAADAQEALVRIRESQPPIALVDVTLGETSGYDLCQQIKGSHPDVRVMLLSSKQTPYDSGRGAAVGADDHIDKPFDTQSLIDKVRSLTQQGSAVPSAPPRPIAPQPTVAVTPQRVSSAAPPAQSPVVAAAEPVSAPPMARVSSVPAAAPAAAAPAATAAALSNGSLEGKLEQLGLSPEQVTGVLALSREVVEQAVWEVVPALAEAMIKEEIQRLTQG